MVEEIDNGLSNVGPCALLGLYGGFAKGKTGVEAPPVIEVNYSEISFHLAIARLWQSGVQPVGLRGS